MAGIILDIGEDIKRLRELKQEIEDVKSALSGINVKVDIDIAKGLEDRLKSLMGTYGDLAGKMADAEARAKESAARMEKATAKVAEAQAKAYGSSSGGGNGEAGSAREQAKAYEELAREIDSIMGTREQNIKRVVEEQNAIRLLNKEIKELTGSQSAGSSLSKGEQARLESLNASLMRHKTALSELRQSLANSFKLDNAAATSMNALSQSLGRMRMAYRELSEEERRSTFGQELLASIQQADAKIKELDATIGNHQRNVGNYASGFNGLNMSVQQIVRELPAATMGLNMFFLAISNNLPILTDEIKRAVEMNKQMKAQNQETVPVWKQLVSSIFSWQTALVVAITVMSMYGKEIVAWIGNLFKADDALEETRKRQEAFAKFQKKMNEEWRESVARTAGTQIAQYRKLSREWASLGDNLKAKERFVRNNQQAFHDLGLSVDGVSQAERLFVGNTDAVVSAITARARAAAYEENITKAQQRYIKQVETNWGTKKGGGYYVKAKAGELIGRSTGVVPKDAQWLKEGVDYEIRSSGTVSEYWYTESGAAKENARRNREAIKKLRENNRLAREELKKEIDRNIKGIEEQTKYAQDLFDKAGVEEYKPENGGSSSAAGDSTDKEASDRLKAQEELNKDLLALQQKNQDDEIALKQDGTKKKLAEINASYGKQKDAIKKQAADMAKENKEAGIGGLNAQGLTQEQQKEIDKAYRLAGEARQASIDETNRQELQAMDEYLAQYGSFQQRKESIARQAAQEIRDIEASTYDEGEKRWRVRAVRERAERETADVEAEAVTARVDWYQVFGNLGGIMTSAMRPMLEELKAYTRTDDFQRLGAERQQRIVEAMGSMRSMMGDNTDLGWRDLAADLTDYQQALREATLAQRELEQKERSQAATLEKLRKAMEKASAEGDEEAYSEAKGQYDTIMLDLADSGRQVAKANDKVRTSGTKLAQTTEAVAQPMDEIHAFLSTAGLTDLQALWDSFNQLRGGVAALKALNEAGKNVGNAGEKIAEGAEKAGEEVAKSLGEGLSKAGIIGQIVAAILKILDVLRDGIGPVISSLIDSILGAINGLLDNILSGQFISQIVGSLVKGVGNIVDTIIGALGSVLSFGALSSGGPSEWFGGSNAEEVQKTIERLTERNKLLQQSIEDLTSTIEGGEGTKSVAAYEEAVRLQEEMEQNLLEMARAQAGYVGSHHSWNAYWGGFTQDEIAELSRRIGRDWNGDLFDLSPDEMKELRSMVDTWARIQNTGKGGYGGRLTEKLDDYIEQAGQMEELTDQLNESLTQVSFDSLYDSFVDTLMDMDASAEDFANDFSEYMMRALLSNQVGEEMKKQLEDWYGKWAEYMKDNKLTDMELSDLRGEWDNMVQQGLEMRDQLAQVVGYDGENDSQQQQASAGYTLATSQESVDVLNGRLNAVYECELRIEEQGRSMVDVSSEIRSIIAQSYLELQQISENTGAIIVPIQKMQKDIEQVKKNTASL